MKIRQVVVWDSENETQMGAVIYVVALLLHKHFETQNHPVNPLITLYYKFKFSH